MTTIRVVCQHCSFSRDVPAEKVPDRPVQVTCPSCSGTFVFNKPSLAEAAGAPSPPAQAPAAGSMVPVPAVAENSPQESGAERGSPPQVPLPKPARRAAPLAEEPAPAGRPAPLALVVLLFLAVVGAGWWLNCPSISAVPDGAHLDSKNCFAVKAPADWLLITPENYKTMVTQFADKIPTELSGMMGRGKPGFTVSFLKIPATETEFAPNFNLAVIDTKGKNLPALTESEKNKAVESITKEFSKGLPTYRLLESRIIQVDGVDSLQITGEAELTVVTKRAVPIYSEGGAFGLRRVTGHTEAESQTYRIRAIQTMIPGKKRAYALNFMFDDLKTPEMGTLHSEVLETFRLLERPPRFGGIVMGSLNGGIFGAGLYMFGLLIGRFFRSQE